MNLSKKTEKIVCDFLKSRNFRIVSTNWWLKRWGEIDIIAIKDKCYYFIEVKSLTNDNFFDPSIHYHYKKKEKFHQLVNYYVNKNKIENFICWLVTVVKKEKSFLIKIFENV